MKHDPYRHIGQQILRFAISYKASGRKIKRVLLKDIQKKKQSMDLVNKILKRDGYRNIDALLEDIIFDKEVGCIVVIDESTSELENVLSQLSIKTDIIQFQTFKNNEGSMIHKFEEFQSDIKSTATSAGIRDLEELDTVVVPAREDGFNDVFLGKDCWYSIRMSGAMVDRIKYIAAYQVAPVSAITHMAEVSRIERYENTNKYILYFKEPAHEIKAIVLPKDKKGLAPQSPRYTSFARIKNAKTLKDIF